MDNKYHTHESVLDYGAGVNRYFTAASMADTMTSAFTGATGALQNAWDDNPNTFQNIGISAGSVIESAGYTVTGTYLGVKGYLNHGSLHARNINGTVYKQLSGSHGNWVSHNVGGGVTSASMTNDAMEGLVKNGSAEKGFLRKTGKFVKHMSMAKSLTVGALLPMAAGYIGGKAIGLAGKVLDSAYSEDRTGRQVHYDNRFFDTQKNQASAYNQIGMALDNAQMKMVSVARIYHSR